MQLLRFHMLARGADHGIRSRQNGLIRITERPRLRQFAAECLADHRQRALREIAEIVCQIRIGAIDDRLMAVVSVLSERHLAQEEIAELVDAISIGHRERVDHVTNRFRHLLPTVKQKTVRENPLRHLDAG